MKNILSASLLVASLLFSQSALAAKTFNGPTDLKEEEFNEDVIVNGPLKLYNTTFKKSLKVNGPLTASDSELNEVNVTGPAELKNLDVKNLEVTGPLHTMSVAADLVKVTGNVVVEDTDIKVLTVDSNKAVISNSDVITFNSAAKGELTLVVKEDSTVSKVVFPNKKGTVIIEDAYSTIRDVDGVEVKRNKPSA